MKKILISLLAILTIGVGAIGLTACNGNENTPNISSSNGSVENGGKGDENCAHNYVIIDAVEPTCEKSGLKAGTICSLCGHELIKQEIVDALGHDFKNYVYNDDATCQANGTETAVCERLDCKAEDSIDIALNKTSNLNRRK